MHRHRWLWLLSILPISPVLPVLPVLCAQAPSTRLQLAALRDSVVQIASTDAAMDMANTERSALNRDKSDAALLIQAGLAQLRVGQLSGDRAPLDQAQALFDEAVYRAPDDWPWPWYGLALADLALDSANVVVKPSMHQAAGVYYRRAGIMALTHAIEADPAFAPAAGLLAALIIPEADQDLDIAVQRAVRLAAAQPAATGAQLALGRMLRNLGHPDSSLHAFRSYINHGGDRALGLLESARMLNALDSTIMARKDYFDGATAIADSTGRSAYRRDVAWVASDAELAAFDSLAVDSIRPWLERFWAKRDARELRAPGERLAEHFRRWRHVYANFQVVGRRDGPRFASNDPRQGCNAEPDVSSQLVDATAGNLAASAHGHRIVDDRGIIYMRHGKPDRVAFSGPCLAWEYWTSTGRLILQFGPSQLLGIQAPTTLVSMFPLSYDLYDAMTSLDMTYAAIASQIMAHSLNHHWEQLGQRVTASGSPMGAATSQSWNIISRPLIERVRSARERDLRTGLTTDGFPLHFRHQLDPRAQFYAVGEPGQVLVVFALPGGQLHGDSLPGGGIGYEMQLRVIATEAQGMVARLDTTRRFRADHALGEGEFLFGLERLRLSPGTWEVRLLASEAGTDTGGAIGRVDVEIPSSATFALSDLVLGRTGSGLRWQGGDGIVPLSPLDAYAPHGAAELYYELHDATPGARYRTSIELKAAYGAPKGAVHLTFEERAEHAFVRARRSIGLDKLEPGLYRITVTVTEQGTGRTATRSRLLNVTQ
jgi:tetratricopeptide (TPR) repeat protein